MSQTVISTLPGARQRRQASFRCEAPSLVSWCKLCSFCPGFVSTSSSDYYTCYYCKHHQSHHIG